MDRIKLVSELYASRLVAVIRSRSAEDALAIAHAAADGGIKFIEITFTVPGALEVIKDLAARKDVRVGAGTVLAPQQAERAIGVGARIRCIAVFGAEPDWHLPRRQHRLLSRRRDAD
jgi:2-dehydro-3-deoxyphosphogluconate aldolase / (4S)-4-hydroxy-2-oxoglutarate aldolase